jgi:GTPase SAR1 family protein
MCDEPLTKRECICNDALLKNLNKKFVLALIGKAGSGKTSFLVSLLNQKNKYLNRVFHKIYVFMPQTSRASMKDNIFESLPDDQLFEGVTFENLSTVYNQLLENSEGGKLSLLVFDDCQAYLKNKEVEVNLLHIIANRRHLKTSVCIVAQNYIKIPLDIRKSFTQMAIFNINKEEWKYVFDENINVPKLEFDNVLKEFKKTKKEEPNTFLFVADGEKLFINWKECIFDEDEEQDK